MAHSLHPTVKTVRNVLSIFLASFQIGLVHSYQLDPNSTDSITKVAKSMTQDLLTFYNGDKPGGTPGLLPQPYYWWEAGAMMGTLIDYWYYTGDEQYNDLVSQALLFQASPTHDYMPNNQTLTEGNDDQGFWGLSVMTAAEYNFPNPPSDQPQWLGLAQGVFNTQAARWDSQNCGGGLRWQIFTWNAGYDYKNSISAACFFALGARLGLYTGNTSYTDWAEKTWDWMVDVQFINTKTYAVYDGASIDQNCTDIAPWQWTYNAGGFILGAAALYNMTESDVWKTRLDNLLQGALVFFTGPDRNIMTEVACEGVHRCDLDEQSFKAYLSRWLAAVTKWAPHTTDFIMPLLRASAVAAASQCKGGDNGQMCGLIWNDNGTWDGSQGVGQQMAAIEVTLSCMIQDRESAHTSDTGGTSKGDPGGGGSDVGVITPAGRNFKPIGPGDQAGAAILTAVVVGVFISGILWLMMDETSTKSPLEQAKGFPRSLAVLAAGGAVAGRVLRKRSSSSSDMNEKSAAHATASGVLQDSSGSSRASSEIQRPMSVVNVRSEGVSRHSRRLSNMPLGWPHNPSLREGSHGAESHFDRHTSLPAAGATNPASPSPLRHSTSG